VGGPGATFAIVAGSAGVGVLLPVGYGQWGVLLVRNLGQYENARELAEEALTIRRELAAARPDAFRADLATSFGNLAGHLRDLGQYEKARELAEEALTIRRELAAARPDAFRADLATSFSNLAGHLSDLGEYEYEIWRA
jgi:tetratricopeptide (TPR) repeat protein